MSFLKIKSYLKKSVTLPPHVVIKKAIKKVHNRLTKNLYRERDINNSTYTLSSQFNTDKTFRYFHKIYPKSLSEFTNQIFFLSEQALEHRFNFFGSGWVQLRPGIKCKGRENFCYPSSKTTDHNNWMNGMSHIVTKGNLSYSQYVFNQISDTYIPIEWHIDFISGYKWCPKTWFRDIVIGKPKGADIKVPWELSRSQHFPQLAFAFLLSKNNHHIFKSPEVYQTEFTNQIFDFIASNPPRFGPNWVCPMDIAIRAANWLVTYDLFKSFGAEFSSIFEKIFFNSIYDHGIHIINHLEWDPYLRGNHYLSDLVGLLFIASYLPSNPEIDSWLALSIQEFINEIKSQFYSDGSNFEGSTTYHRLSGEMAAYGTAIILALGQEKQAGIKNYSRSPLKGLPFQERVDLTWHSISSLNIVTPLPETHFLALEKIALFSKNITKPNFQVPQIGDNDNGRFFKFLPIFNNSFIDNLGKYSEVTEDHLDQRCLISAINGLVPRKDFSHYSQGFELDGILIKSLFTEDNKQITKAKYNATQVNDGDLVNFFYPDFGLYLYRSKYYYFIIRCGQIGQKGNGGHSHNDQLSFDLSVNGIDFFSDPGTYLYTPLPERRNEFRSSKMHNTLVPMDKEQNVWLPGIQGLFSMNSNLNARVIQLNKCSFSGEHNGYGILHRRTIDFSPKTIYGIDEYREKVKKSVYFHMVPEVTYDLDTKLNRIILKKAGSSISLKCTHGKWSIENSFYSPGYGLIQNSKTLKFKTCQEIIKWEIQVL